MEKLLDNIKWTFKLYSLTLIIPVVFSIINIICAILNVETKYGFLSSFKMIWLDYYITGYFLDIEAWRWQLGFLFGSFLFNFFQND